MGCRFAQCEILPELESGSELYEFFWESSTQCSYQCSNVLPVSWELDEGKIVVDDHDRMIKVIYCWIKDVHVWRNKLTSLYMLYARIGYVEVGYLIAWMQEEL